LLLRWQAVIYLRPDKQLDDRQSPLDATQARTKVSLSLISTKVFGEAVALLQAEGKADAAILFEQLGNDLAKTHEVDIPTRSQQSWCMVCLTRFDFSGALVASLNQLLKQRNQSSLRLAASNEM
jgi:hypothetical protein